MKKNVRNCTFSSKWKLKLTGSIFNLNEQEESENMNNVKGKRKLFENFFGSSLKLY